MALIDFRNGELIGRVEEMDDEEVLSAIKELESVASNALRLSRYLRAEVLTRMVRDGAKLRLTKVARARVYNESKLVDGAPLESLYADCPEVLKTKCFRVEYKPLKRGLDELAKLGSDWRDRVEGLYEQEQVLRIEWL